MDAQHKNPYSDLLTELTIGGKNYRYFDLLKLKDERVAQLPVCIKILLECAIRNCDEFSIKKSNVESILDWVKTSTHNVILYLCRPKSHSNHLELFFKI